jgi:hypothetical protein
MPYSENPTLKGNPMKNLVTITGAPTSTGAVVKEVALQLGKIAAFWIAADVMHKVVYKISFDYHFKKLTEKK